MSYQNIEDPVYQNKEEKKRAAELIIANKELVFQNEEKEKRAAELIMANKELAYQNEEKEKRAAELIIANEELIFQNEEKEKRAAELIIANKELAFQNKEKEKRAAELIIANKELAFQNEEKEKRAAELIIANKELLAFTYISSHHLQEPLRKIINFSGRILEKEFRNLSDEGKDHFQRMQSAVMRMQQLIKDLLTYSQINDIDNNFELTDLNIFIDKIKLDFKTAIREKHAIIEAGNICPAYVIPLQFYRLMYHLADNSLKFSKPGTPPHIVITSELINGDRSIAKNLLPEKNYCHIIFKDNGIGFDPQYKDRIFELFQRLHGHDEYEGTGIGLAIVKKIIENHNGAIIVTSKLDEGTTFHIYIPSEITPSK